MQIKRLDIQRSAVSGVKDLAEEMYEGPITKTDADLAQRDPAAFLKKAGVSVPEGAHIHVSAERLGGTPANAPAGHVTARAVGAIHTGMLCRVTIIRIGSIIIVRITCVPVIIVTVPACW